MFGLTICMIQGNRLFYNTGHVQERLRVIADELPADTRWLVIDASAIPQIDSTATIMLEEVHTYLKKRGIALAPAELHTDARALACRRN
ncbi:STAS domain protein [Sinorhizobium sp. KGO-5]|uniref:sodium-independent anion transporter n=1 Tax=Sinorhizobium sp. KGO-5 TaxID=1470810 RepID=UPI002949E13C|nr:STAS domain protein [Sinorhizobium sp. KGO-5]